MIPELFSNVCFYSMYSQIKFCGGKKNAISVYVFLFYYDIVSGSLIAKNRYVCNACRSFAFPLMLEEALDKPCYLQSAKKQRILFYCKLHVYKLHHWKCCFILCSFCIFFLQRLDPGCHWKMLVSGTCGDVILHWHGLHVILLMFVNCMTCFACMILEMSELNDITIWDWIACFCESEFKDFGLHELHVFGLICFGLHDWHVFDTCVGLHGLHVLLAWFCMECLKWSVMIAWFFYWMTCI